jgi:hypothetical protein
LAVNLKFVNHADTLFAGSLGGKSSVWMLNRSF